MLFDSKNFFLCCFLLTSLGSEYGHMGFREGLIAWRLKSLYRKKGFSQERYDVISRKIAELETQINLQSNETITSSHRE